MKTVEEYLRENPSFEHEVMSVKSPRSRVGGPYKIVKICDKGDYAIVTLYWDENPALGIRWFDKYPGMPASHGYRTWFIIPSGLWNAIIPTLDEDKQDYVRAFLQPAGE